MPGTSVVGKISRSVWLWAGRVHCEREREREGGNGAGGSFFSSLVFFWSMLIVNILLVEYFERAFELLYESSPATYRLLYSNTPVRTRSCAHITNIYTGYPL